MHERTEKIIVLSMIFLVASLAVPNIQFVGFMSYGTEATRAHGDEEIDACLKIVSTPAIASVYVNNQYAGLTSSNEETTADTHGIAGPGETVTIRVEKPGFITQEKVLTVPTANVCQSVYFVLDESGTTQRANCIAPYNSYFCYDSNTETCPAGTQFTPFYCPGSANIQCCAPSTGTPASTCNDLGGTCFPECAPGDVEGPGTCEPSNWKCCTPRSTQPVDCGLLQGVCRPPSPGCPSGYYSAGKCNAVGTSDEICCVQDSGIRTKKPSDYTECSSCTLNAFKWCSTNPLVDTLGSCTSAASCTAPAIKVDDPLFCRNGLYNKCTSCNLIGGSGWCTSATPSEDIGYCSTEACASPYVTRVINVNQCPAAQGGTSALQYLQCTNKCTQNVFTRSPGSIGIGYCSTDPSGNIPNDVRSRISSIGVAKTPYPISDSGLCAQNEKCWCVEVAPSASFQFPNIYVPPYQYTVGQPPARWADPAQKRNPSVVLPNTYLCDEGASATLRGTLSKTAIQKGDSIKVSVDVGKTSSMCKGFKYECRSQEIIQCKQIESTFKLKLEAPDCPSGMKSIWVEGEESHTKWARFFGVISLVSTTFLLIVVPAFSIALPAKLLKILTNMKEVSSAFTAFFATTGPARLPACFRVCAFDFPQDAVTTSPQCTLSGYAAGYVLSDSEASYPCTPSSASVCGPYAGKSVRIQLMDPFGQPYGSVVTAVADTNGQASHEFRIDGKVGKYTAIVTVD